MAATNATSVLSAKTQRALANSTASLSRTCERLASGQRINRAADDAAALAVAAGLNADARVYTRAIRNVNDGLSAVAVTVDALKCLENITIRISELAAESANGVLNVRQRQALDDEAQALSDEYSRVVGATKFNKQGLLNGSVVELRIQAGFGAAASIATPLSCSQSVLTTVGTGDFSLSSTSYSGANAPYEAIAAGDVNGDGKLDIAVAGMYDTGTPQGKVYIRLGNGDGTFQSGTVSYDTEGYCSTEVLLHDVNSDGKLDLLTGGREDGPTLAVATVRLGNGDGTFGAAVSYVTPAGAATGGLAAGDINNDGKVDLVHAPYNVHVRLGNGDGTFQSASQTWSDFPGTVGDVKLIDLNGDDFLDYIAAGRSGSDGVAAVRLGNGNGTFGSAVTYATETYHSYGLAVGDVSGDGQLDLVTCGYVDGGTGGYVTVRFGNGNGTFSATAVSYAAESGVSWDVSLYDQDSDGDLDIITAGKSSGDDGFMTVRLNNGNGSFSSSSVSYSTEGRVSTAMAMGDFNGDTVSDVVTAGRPDTWEGAITVRLADSQTGLQTISLQELPEIDLSTLIGAREALPELDRTRSGLQLQIGTLGAFESRLVSAVNTVSIAGENYHAAYGRIMDADVAQETAELARNAIMQKTAAAMLAQANQSWPLVTRLLL